MLQVLTEEPAPPRRLRPGVPRDLETICLKCLAEGAGPALRVGGGAGGGPGALAARRADAARPVGAVERAAKWVRRRPAVAAAYGLLLAVLVLGMGGGGATWLWLRAEARRADERGANGRRRGCGEGPATT